MFNGIIHPVDTFQKAMTFSLRWEGGYVNNPADHGGATNQGITQATYDAFRRNRGFPPQPVKQITPVDRDWIYRTSYWDKIDGDHKPARLAIACFDFAVNSGPKRALEMYVPDLEQYLHKRKLFCIAIAHGTQHQFLTGWLNRIDALREYLNDSNNLT